MVYFHYESLYIFVEINYNKTLYIFLYFIYCLYRHYPKLCRPRRLGFLSQHVPTHFWHQHSSVNTNKNVYFRRKNNSIFRGLYFTNQWLLRRAYLQNEWRQKINKILNSFLWRKFRKMGIFESVIQNTINNICYRSLWN